MSAKYAGRRGPSYGDKCKECSYISEHKDFLASQRKFVKGETVTTVDELLQQEWLIWGDTTKHVEVFKHMPLYIVLRLINAGQLRRAIRKETINEKVVESEDKQ